MIKYLRETEKKIKRSKNHKKLNDQKRNREVERKLAKQNIIKN